MSRLYLEPSTLIWDEAHFNNTPHLYDNVINDVISLLELELAGDCELILLQGFVDSLLEYCPFYEINNGHWKNSRDFTTQVTQAITKWMSSELILDSIDPNCLINNVNCQPELLQINDTIIDDIRKKSNSCLYSKKEYAVVSFNPNNITDVTLDYLSEIGEILDTEPRPLFNTFDKLQKYFDNNRLTCEFSPKHHPASGWGTRMAHENLAVMQSLLEVSLFEEANEFRVRYAYDTQEQVYYAFRVTNGLTFHPYPVGVDEVPNLVLRSLSTQ
ncbi:hypothetical protein GLP37_03650 [Photobacterium phosphoreum]|uniref:hypothetical protein n=1 Tax=Photobacterium phosphoreum TaxID=659 RepID=UPI001E58B470|nr:hypothetical protein [Photobacterium phosphoreum]MCD9501291.1 hypothetical protein [Photobacterium phosphoreum]